MWSNITLGMSLFCAVLALSAVGCTSGARVELPEATRSNGVLVETTGLYRQGYATVVGIDGKAVNETGRNLRLCAVHFDVFNDEGEKVGGAIAATNGLAPGGIWRFQAVFTTPFSTPFKRIELNRVDAQ